MSHEPERLSRSALWQMQRRYFDEAGIRAWSEAAVPQYVTSNPWIAEAYAMVVVGWMRDLAGADALDRSQPLYIVELGCGSGRFGHHFFRALRAAHRLSPLRDISLRYVYTDFTDATLDVLRSHPSVQPLVGEGVLDFARFDLERDSEFRLTHSGEVLRADTLANPLAVLANYVFDGVPQDCFSVENGVLYEARVRTTGETLEDVALAWERQPALRPCYEDRSWETLLDDTRDGTILFPVAALQCIARLVELARGRLLLVSGDKGSVGGERDQGPPHVALHGSVSLMVDYDIITRWISARGGEVLQTEPRTSSLAIIAAVFGADAVETRLTFAQWIDRRGPDDYLALKRSVERHADELSLEELLAWLRFSGWDADVFAACASRLVAYAPLATDAQSAELRAAVRQVWERYFPLREPHDIAFDAGQVLLESGAPDEAAELFEASIRLYGPEEATLRQLERCRTVRSRRDRHAQLQKLP